MARNRTFLFNALVPLAALVLLIPAAEILVRVVRPQPLPSQEFLRGFLLPGMYEEDPEVQYRLAHGYAGRIERLGIVTEFRTNSLGMRGAEPGPKSGPRVLALGDSYTFGWGVGEGEEWIHVVGAELNRRLGRDDVESWNGGVNGYGTRGAFATLKRVAPLLRPDIVLLGFFANDFTDNVLGSEIFEVRDGWLFDRFSSDYFREHFLARESHLYRLVSVAWETARVKYFGGVPTNRAVKNFTPEEFEEGSRIAETTFREMQDYCDGIGARFGIVWLPADVYVLSGSRPEDIPLRAKLQERTREDGIESIDLLPVALEQDRRSGLYLLPADGHLSVRGNRVLGRAIAAWLAATGWLPGAAESGPAPEASEGHDNG